MRERLFRLTLEYDGTAYQGFQRLPRQEAPTIQGVLEQALGRLVDHPVKVLAAGRTDAGVHATGQVISFRTRAARSAAVVCRGANALLPEDIRVLEASEAPDDFHPRFSARSRTYQYLLLPSERLDAVFTRRAWRVHHALDVDRMNEAARLLLGRHDFSTFCAQVPERDARVRTLLECEAFRWTGSAPGPLARLEGLVVLQVRADAFLRRMVRMLTGTLVKVGRGLWEPEEPRRILDLRDPGACPAPAPPWGLYLVSVEYGAGLGREGQEASQTSEGPPGSSTPGGQAR